MIELITDIDEIIQTNIENENYEMSDDHIICPYCGYSEEVSYEMCFGNDLPDVYTEGEETLTCPQCNHSFLLTKTISWDYTMEMIKK